MSSQFYAIIGFTWVVCSVLMSLCALLTKAGVERRLFSIDASVCAVVSLLAFGLAEYVERNPR